jgi:hypothetical protein
VSGSHGISTPRSEPALQAWAAVRVREYRVGPGRVDNALCTAVAVLAEDPERPPGEIIAAADDLAAGRAVEEIADFEPSGLHFPGEKLLEPPDQAASQLDQAVTGRGTPARQRVTESGWRASAATSTPRLRARPRPRNRHEHHGERLGGSVAGADRERRRDRRRVAAAAAAAHSGPGCWVDGTVGQHVAVGITGIAADRLESRRPDRGSQRSSTHDRRSRRAGSSDHGGLVRSGRGAD